MSAPILPAATGAMDAQSIGCSTCPFCPFFDPNGDFVLQHVQYCHPEIEPKSENEPKLEPTKPSPQVIFRTGLESEPIRFSGYADGSNGELSGSLYHADNMTNLEESPIAQYTHSRQPHVNSGDFRNRSTSPHTSRNDQIEPPSQITPKNMLNRSTKRLGVRLLPPSSARWCLYIYFCYFYCYIYTNKISDSVQS